jgi:alkanesulfonate monooxygenase SsuD/methylene tetrahydromethanopterin reductase-like flavin-dependent oxidoreductase (luciferase family)
LRVGVQLPEVERQDVRWPEYLAIARAAEEVGFDSIWVGDHLLYRGDDQVERGPWEAWTLLAALAAATERVEVGPLVACTAFHSPGLIAKMAATVQEISGGRLVLGLGAGWNEEEFRAFGLPFDHRVSRFEESFEVIRGLLSGERVTLNGRYVQAEDAVLLPRPSAPPRLMVGSSGPRMLAATLPRGLRGAERPHRRGGLPSGPRPRRHPAQRVRARRAERRERRAPLDLRSARAPIPGAHRHGAGRARGGGRRRGDPGRRPDHRTLDPPAGRRGRPGAA